MRAAFVLVVVEAGQLGLIAHVLGQLGAGGGSVLYFV